MKKNFTEKAIREKKIKDDVPDQHSILVFINEMAERPKLTSRRKPIPGTFIGAVSLRVCIHFITPFAHK